MLIVVLSLDTADGGCGKTKVDGDDNNYDSVGHNVVLTLILAMMLMVVMVWTNLFVMMMQMVVVVIAVFVRMLFLILKADEDDYGDEQTESVTGNSDECYQSCKTDMKVGVMQWRILKDTHSGKYTNE